MPDADRVDGTCARMPLSVRGQSWMISTSSSRTAKLLSTTLGCKQILDDLLEMDEGARRLVRSRWWRTFAHQQYRDLVQNTLFGERLLSLCFGAGLCESGRRDRKKRKENRKLGMNNSLIHVDFMVGQRCYRDRY